MGNDLKNMTSECDHNEGCRGTCPECRAEMRRQKHPFCTLSFSGKTVAFAGIAAGFILMSGCGGTSTRTPLNDNPAGEFIDSTEMVDETMADGNGRIYWAESEVDEKPRFPGGDEAMQRYFNDCYSKEKDAIIGHSTIGYIVNSRGKIEFTEIIEGDSLLGGQLIRIINQFPDYTPGKIKGRPVDVYMTFSMSMSLNVGVDTIK